MSKIVQITVLLTAVFFFSGCKKNYFISPEQEMLFQVDIISYEPGYRHYGYIINMNGDILTYDNPEKWNFPGSNFNITEDQAAENISMCRVSGRIPAEELSKFSHYIDNIASSRVTALKKSGDEGSVQYICYRFSESSHIYKGYTIRIEGNYTGENLNFYSKKVIVWMKELNNQLFN